MPDERMSRIERDNAETIHFLETPLRWLMRIIRGVFMVAVIVIVVLGNQVGWIVDLGNPASVPATPATAT
jgi:hypothetical protein